MYEVNKTFYAKTSGIKLTLLGLFFCFILVVYTGVVYCRAKAKGSICLIY